MHKGKEQTQSYESKLSFGFATTTVFGDTNLTIEFRSCFDENSIILKTTKL
jgi:hypothetical protein